MAAGLVLPSAAYAHGKGKGPHTTKPVTVACTSLTGNSSGSPSPALGVCSQPTVTGGSGTIAFTGGMSVRGSATVTWTGTSTTKFNYSASLPQSSGNKCAKVAAGDIEAIIHGSVQPPGNGGVKGAVRAKICVATDGTLSLLGSGSFNL
jgi:hypothetical protein